MEIKACPMCGTEADSRERRCLNCDYRFQTGIDSGADDEPEMAVADISDANNRPDGSTPMSIGWACFVLSVLAICISVSIKIEPWEVGPYASPSGLESAAGKLQSIFLLQIAAGGFFSLFLVLWSVGYIVRAISFLPGKED